MSSWTIPGCGRPSSMQGRRPRIREIRAYHANCVPTGSVWTDRNVRLQRLPKGFLLQYYEPDKLLRLPIRKVDRINRQRQVHSMWRREIRDGVQTVRSRSIPSGGRHRRVQMQGVRSRLSPRQTRASVLPSLRARKVPVARQPQQMRRVWRRHIFKQNGAH